MTRQDYGTPWPFIFAVEARYGEIVCDLAASVDNAKCARYISPETADGDRWDLLPEGVLWLNPPFRKIAPWAKKCADAFRDRAGPIVMLVPASIGSLWFSQHVYPHATVVGLRPRLVFEGENDPFPKDLMLCVYDRTQRPGFEVWDWTKACPQPPIASHT